MKPTIFLIAFFTCFAFPGAANLLAGEAKAPWQLDRDRIVEGAKKEGKFVAGIPASAELRKAIGDTFATRFPGIELELTTSRGPTNASKIAAEHAAGVARCPS